MAMARINEETPEWLSTGGIGASLFKPNPSEPKFTDPSLIPTIPRRPIAQKGTFVYVAVGNEIRHADLRYYQTVSEQPEGAAARRPHDYTIIKTNIQHRILHMTVSPNAEFLVVATTHGIHAVNLSRVSAHSEAEISTPVYPIGVNVHNETKSGVVSLLWHPLASRGSSLVTVTEDGFVRIFELDTRNQTAFTRANLVVDLKLLQKAKTAEDIYGVSDNERGGAGAIGVDDMMLASASFGSNSYKGGLWSPMTFWVVTNSGSVYSLCPFLPARWDAPVSILASLWSYIDSITTGSAVDNLYSGANGAISQWYSEIEAQFEKASKEPGFRPESTSLLRPDKFKIPVLAGPLDQSQLYEDVEDALDLMVFSLNHENEVDSFDSVELEIPATGVSHAVILATNLGMIYINLDIHSAAPRWLPRASDADLKDNKARSLFTLDSIALFEREDNNLAPAYFCKEYTNDFSFFVSTDSGIVGISSSFLASLSKELADPFDQGLEKRIEWINSENSVVELITQFDVGNLRSEEAAENTTCVAITGLGVFKTLVLAKIEGEIIATFVQRMEEEEPIEPIVEHIDEDDLADIQSVTKDWKRYIPPALPSLDKELISFFQKHQDGQSSKQNIVFSSYIFKIMLDMHRFLSKETGLLRNVVSDLFIRCADVRRRYLHLLKGYQRTHQLLLTVPLVKNPAKELSAASGKGKELDVITLQKRYQAVVERQKKLNSRTEMVVLKVADLSGRQVSAKEQAWMAEIKRHATEFGVSTEDPDNAPSERTESEESPMYVRVKDIVAEKDALQRKVEHLIQRLEVQSQPPTPNAESSWSGMSQSRRETLWRKEKQLQGLEGRLTATVDAIATMVEKLKQTQI